MKKPDRVKGVGGNPERVMDKFFNFPVCEVVELGHMHGQLTRDRAEDVNVVVI